MVKFNIKIFFSRQVINIKTVIEFLQYIAHILIHEIFISIQLVLIFINKKKYVST